MGELKNKILKCLNLTDMEYDIFESILRHGATPLGKVIKELGIHKGTAYNSIRRLEEKGYISATNIEGISVYSINVFSLNKLLEEVNNKQKESAEIITELVKKAESIKNTEHETKVDVLLGIEGFKTFFNGMYDWAHKHNKEFCFLGKGNEMVDYLGEDYFKLTQAKKKNLNIKCRVIMNEVAIDLPVSKHIFGNVRYLKMKDRSPSSIWIYGDRVTIVLWESKPITTIMMRSREIATSFQNYFQTLWEVSYNSKMVFNSLFKVNIYEFMQQAENSIDILGLNGLLPVHEGRSKLMELLNAKKRVRVLIANPDVKKFRERVFDEEPHIKKMSESRILSEWNATLANLKDIYRECKKTSHLEVRAYDDVSCKSRIFIDDKLILCNDHEGKCVRCGDAGEATIINGRLDGKAFKQELDSFETLWHKSRPVKL
jgi:predicted transcriptional regulator